MSKRKRIGHESITGDKGIAFIHRIVLDMGFVWNVTHLEAGVDGYIEIRDIATGDVTNCIIQVQSKAGSSWFKAETEETFEFVCDERDLNYWLAGNAPVILVVSRPDLNEGYWKSIKDYFHDPIRRKLRKIVFEKQSDRFNLDARQRVSAIALPANSGLYLTAIPKTETLVANLLPLVRHPESIFHAKTTLRYPDQVWGILNRHAAGSFGEWLLHDGNLYSIHDLRIAPWRECCLPATVERHPMADWAKSDDSKERYVFVRLMTFCLNSLLFAQGVRYSKDKEHHFFRATLDLSERKVGGLSVFKAYISKTNPDRIAYYRHRAMRLQMLRLDGEWFAEITPSYHFTQNGYTLSRYFEERLSGIKMIERQNKVHLRQVRLWAEVLQQVHVGKAVEPGTTQRSLFDELEEKKPEALIAPYSHLTFGSLVEFQVDCSVPEIAWLPTEAPEPLTECPQDSSSGGLFE